MRSKLLLRSYSDVLAIRPRAGRRHDGSFRCRPGLGQLCLLLVQPPPRRVDGPLRPVGLPTRFPGLLLEWDSSSSRCATSPDRAAIRASALLVRAGFELGSRGGGYKCASPNPEGSNSVVSRPRGGPPLRRGRRRWRAAFGPSVPLSTLSPPVPPPRGHRRPARPSDATTEGARPKPALVRRPTPHPERVVRLPEGLNRSGAWRANWSRPQTTVVGLRSPATSAASVVVAIGSQFLGDPVARGDELVQRGAKQLRKAVGHHRHAIRLAGPSGLRGSAVVPGVPVSLDRRAQSHCRSGSAPTDRRRPVPLQRGEPFPPLRQVRRPPRCSKGRRWSLFTVWAPDAEYVSVIGEFNEWDRATTRSP